MRNPAQFRAIWFQSESTSALGHSGSATALVRRILEYVREADADKEAEPSKQKRHDKDRSVRHDPDAVTEPQVEANHSHICQAGKPSYARRPNDFDCPRFCSPIHFPPCWSAVSASRIFFRGNVYVAPMRPVAATTTTAGRGCAR
jgi:hypothetical protein